MIISHKYRYLFIEIPLTGSWAIRHQLVDHYDGQPILHKHANYLEFKRTATDDERKYFAFATVRNPLDVMVSGFFKHKTDHKGVFSNAENSIESNVIDYADVNIHEKISQEDFTFESIFTRSKLWERPYTDMIEVSAEYLDYVIRFERLQEDFAEVLRLLGIEQVGPIPVTNKTRDRAESWESYYTPQVYEQVKRRCGPFMKKWGYGFPAHWGEHQVSRRAELEFRLANWMKKIYLTNFRYNDSRSARIARLLHARLRKYM